MSLGPPSSSHLVPLTRRPNRPNHTNRPNRPNRSNRPNRPNHPKRGGIVLEPQRCPSDF